MPLPVKQIEDFFVAKFEPMSPGLGRELHHYDGAAHWCVLSDNKDHLFITADTEQDGEAFPIVEVSAHCSSVSTSHAGGVGPMLILHPNGDGEPSHYVVLTRTKAGRVSLSLTVGTGPERSGAEG